MGTKKTATATALIDADIKSEAEEVLKEMGLSVSKSFELSCRQVIAQRGCEMGTGHGKCMILGQIVLKRPPQSGL